MKSERLQKKQLVHGLCVLSRDPSTSSSLRECSAVVGFQFSSPALGKIAQAELADDVESISILWNGKWLSSGNKWPPTATEPLPANVTTAGYATTAAAAAAVSCKNRYDEWSITASTGEHAWRRSPSVWRSPTNICDPSATAKRTADDAKAAI